jgi:hypothetical protein
MAPFPNKQNCWRSAVLEVQALRRGGVSLMGRISGLARSTIGLLIAATTSDASFKV